MKNLSLSVLAVLALALSALAQEPSDTRPKTQDSPGMTQVKILKVLNDARTGDGPLVVSGGGAVVPALGAAAGVSLVASTAYEASHVLKASAGTLVSVVGYNSKASAQFVLIFDSATVPANGGVPKYIFTVPTGNFSLDIPITGAPFASGIAISNSSTGPTKTIGSADCWFTAVIK